jgi:hypothetical protein
MPKYILVKLKTQSNSNIIQLDNLPPGVFYIKPHKESFTVALDSHCYTINRTQFPLTLADSFTSHKLQGITTSKVIIDLRSQMHKLDFAYIYVALSRAKSLNYTLILRDFLKVILKSKVPEDLKKK